MNIRHYKLGDEQALSRVIISALRKENAKHYPGELIQEKEREYSPDNITKLAAARAIYVVEDHARIVGTASVEENYISGVFVDPEKMRMGYGRQVMAAAEKVVAGSKYAVAELSSTITAHDFYKKLGYVDVRQDGLNTIMSKQL